MHLPTIRRLYDYNDWANARVLGIVSPLAKADWLKDLGSSFPSVRDTVVHILEAERLWLTRWQGHSPAELWSGRELPDVASVRREWAGLERDRAAFLAGLTDAGLQAPFAYRNTKGEPFEHPLWEQMAHLVNHSTYHRGQVTTMLRQLGAQPVALDFVVFTRQVSPQAGPI
jgi:uncharacterized damage-inducible protein DinB